jgi:hypothetical protein
MRRESPAHGQSLPSIGRRGRQSKAYAPDPAAPGHSCDIPGCAAAGEYRAPKSRATLNEYWWFCLDHVRSYNAGWDFYRGMSPGEIEAQVRADAVGRRPTWPLGRLGGRVDEAALRDELDALGARFAAAATRAAPDVPRELREPLATLGLCWPVSFKEVKQRYKALAKQHHPDANGGDRAAEERLKTINVAYMALRGRLAPAPQPEAAAG